jgi:hypothetical protein
VGVLQDPAGAVQPVEQGGPPARALPPVQPLVPGERLRPFREMLGAEELAADGSGDQFFPCVGSA